MAGASEEVRVNIRKTWARNVMEYAEEDETVEFAKRKATLSNMAPHFANSQLLDKDSRLYLRPKTGGFGYHETEGEEGTVIAFWGTMLKRCKLPAAKLADIVPMTLKILSIESERKFDGENIWSCDDER